MPAFPCIIALSATHNRSSTVTFISKKFHSNVGLVGAGIKIFCALSYIEVEVEVEVPDIEVEFFPQSSTSMQTWLERFHGCSFAQVSPWGSQETKLGIISCLSKP